MVHKSADGRSRWRWGRGCGSAPTIRRGRTCGTHLPARGGAPYRTAIDITHLFALSSVSKEQVYRYCGSLTTGQHEEGITWLVRNHPSRCRRRRWPGCGA